MKNFLILSFVLISTLLYSQKKDKQEIFIDAEYHYLYEEFEEAIESYMQLYPLDSNNANLNYRIGQSIFKSFITILF